MKVRVAKWGNSLGLRLPKAAVEAMEIENGAELDLIVEGRDARLKRIWKIPFYRLEDLIAEMRRLGPQNEPATIDWGPDVGAEIIDDAYSRGEITLDDILKNAKASQRKNTPRRRKIVMLPDAGDIAWVEFDPVKGTEQAGRRPALVLTNRAYHENSRRALVCPITSNLRHWPFNVELPPGLKTLGVVLVDQVRTIDRNTRMYAIIERAPEDFVVEVKGRLATLLGINIVAIARGAEQA